MKPRSSSLQPHPGFLARPCRRRSNDALSVAPIRARHLSVDRRIHSRISLYHAGARNTLLLTVTATLLAWAIALPLGVWSADRLGRLPDAILSWGTAVLLVIPDLALALGLLVLAVRTGWFPTGGMASVDFETLSPLNRLR